MFAPALGVPEDPATGSANGALGAYRVHHAAMHPTLRQAVGVSEPSAHILSEQGAKINRPSTLYIEVDHTGGEISAVRVGGPVVRVAEGTLILIGCQPTTSTCCLQRFPEMRKSASGCFQSGQALLMSRTRLYPPELVPRFIASHAIEQVQQAADRLTNGMLFGNNDASVRFLLVHVRGV